MIAADVSNYSGPIGADRARALKDAGVKRAIVQLVNPDITVHRQQFPALIAAGIQCEAYVYLWFGTDIAERVRWAVGELSSRPGVKRVWLDCEDVTFAAGADPLTVIQGIADAVDVLDAAGYEPGIYTAKWWWVSATRDSKMFAELPLWDAEYDGKQELEAVSYGGWTRQTMHQYAADQMLGGIPNIDLNWYEEDELATRRPTTQEAIQLAQDLRNYGYSVNDNGLADGFDTQVVENPPPGVRQYLVTVKET